MSKENPMQLSPFDLILAAFDHFNTDTLDLQSLIKIAMAANCPSPDIAQTVINNLVKMDMLTWKREGNQILFTIKKPSSSELQ